VKWCCSTEKPRTVSFTEKFTASQVGNKYSAVLLSALASLNVWLWRNDLWHSDNMLISDKPPFQEHWNGTSKHNPLTVLMNCLMFKQQHVCMVICTFTNKNKNDCNQKKLSQICLSYLQLLIRNISFVSMTCISHCPICFVKGVFTRS
jgi:hypothetical protein